MDALVGPVYSSCILHSLGPYDSVSFIDQGVCPLWCSAQCDALHDTHLTELAQDLGADTWPGTQSEKS